MARGGLTMRDSATARARLQELYRPVPEDILPHVTPPPVPAEQPIEVDDEDMQPDTANLRTSCSIARFNYARFCAPLSGTTSRSTTALLTTTSRHSSPGTRQSDDSLVCSSRNTTMDATGFNDSRSATTTLATTSSANHAHRRHCQNR